MLALDERRRALQTQVDELRAERNTAAQAIGEAKRAGARRGAPRWPRAAELREPPRRARGASCATLDARVRDGHARAPEPRRTSRAADGMPRRTRTVHAVSSRPKPEFDFEPRDHLDARRRDDRHGARRAHVGLALRLPARRPRAPARRDRAVRARQARRQGLHARHAARAGARGGARRHGLLPGRRASRSTRVAERRRAVPVGTSEVSLAALHMGEILPEERAAAALLRPLVVLPARGRRGGQATRAASSARTSSRRSRCSRSATPTARGTSTSWLLSIEERDRATTLGLHYRVVNIAAGDLGALGGEEVRHRGVAARPGALPRADVAARTRPTTRPGGSTRRYRTRAAACRAPAHAQRHGRHLVAHADRRARDAPARRRQRRRPRGAAGLRRARRDPRAALSRSASQRHRARASTTRRTG